MRAAAVTVFPKPVPADKIPISDLSIACKAAFCSAYNIAGLNVDGILNLTGNNFSEDYNLERISVKERITSSRCRIAGMNVGKFPIEEYLV